MSKTKISKKVHNAFVKEYKGYEKLLYFNSRKQLEAEKRNDEERIKEYDRYCRMYVSRMVALEILYQKLTSQDLEGQSIRWQQKRKEI